MPRKIIHLSVSGVDHEGFGDQHRLWRLTDGTPVRYPGMGFAALCDDGSVWAKGPTDGGWVQLPDIPTDEELAAERDKEMPP